VNVQCPDCNKQLEGLKFPDALETKLTYPDMATGALEPVSATATLQLRGEFTTVLELVHEMDVDVALALITRSKPVAFEGE
jgi:hypothetical protein